MTKFEAALAPRYSTVSDVHPRISVTNKLTKRQLFWLVPMFAAAGLFWASQTGKSNSGVEKELQASDLTDASTPMPVNVHRVEQVDSFEQTRTYTGTIRARHRSDLGFEIGGRITAVMFDEGDSVTAGQILATLDTDTLQAQKNATLANLDQARAVLAELSCGPKNRNDRRGACHRERR